MAEPRVPPAIFGTGIAPRVREFLGPRNRSQISASGSIAMHIHPNLVNPNTQLHALYASERTAAKREAANTRKKLLEFAESVGESDSEEACVVTLEAREESQ